MVRRQLSEAGMTVALLALMATTASCGAPVLTRDGKLVFQEPGASGASVITANGVELIDKADHPLAVVRRTVDEPWRAPIGFLLPANGILTKVSKPVPVQGRGLAVVLRSSDVIVPSWGGEVLLRLDAIAPVAAFPKVKDSVRPPMRLAIVVDGAGPETMKLLDMALDDLGEADHVGIVDAEGGKPLLPLVPGSHRTLLHAAVEKLLEQRPASKVRASGKHTAAALATARGWVSVQAAGEPADTFRQVLLLTDGAGVPANGSLAAAAKEVTAAGVGLSAVATAPLETGRLASLGDDVHAGTPIGERMEAVERAVPAPGAVVLDDVSLSISSVPAPTRVIESSGGQSALGLFADNLSLGQLYAGEARTEVVRLGVPQWVPGEPLELTVTAKYKDVQSGKWQSADATIRCRYSNDVVEIANARHGDVIAYASALAMVRRLHRAFLGSEVDKLGGLRRIAEMQARSLTSYAKRTADPALGAQAEILGTLLGVIEDD